MISNDGRWKIQDEIFLIPLLFYDPNVPEPIMAFLPGFPVSKSPKHRSWSTLHQCLWVLMLSSLGPAPWVTKTFITSFPRRSILLKPDGQHQLLGFFPSFKATGPHHWFCRPRFKILSPNSCLLPPLSWIFCNVILHSELCAPASFICPLSLLLGYTTDLLVFRLNSEGKGTKEL